MVKKLICGVLKSCLILGKIANYNDLEVVAVNRYKTIFNLFIFFSFFLVYFRVQKENYNFHANFFNPHECYLNLKKKYFSLKPFLMIFPCRQLDTNLLLF